MGKRIVFSVFLFFFIGILLSVIHTVYADDDYNSDFQVEYFITNDHNVIQSHVNFNIKVTNNRSDVFVSKFAISFPRTFTIRNLQATDDSGVIQPNLTVDAKQTKVEMEFAKPNTGKGSVNNFYMHFVQDNLFKANGNVWEVILPTIDNRSSSNYKVIVHLPPDTDKKISIAKPKPTEISGNQIIWENPTTRTIYAVFGSKQLYRLQLGYHISNPKYIPVYTEIAFPPDTLYQKNVIESIKPPPDSTYIDSDGNFLGRYFLKPKEIKDIVYTSTTEINSVPREEMKSVISEQFSQQQQYLLTAQKYWQLNQLSKITPLKTVADVYHFTRDSLRYDYNRTAIQNTRYGAEAILSKPDQAVCVEFSDLFIATAREKGIYSREIEGYGFSFDPQIRPLSLISDVLHSWPEYYDTNNNLWIPVDPTWENTSGIDYYSSLDLNHIAFVIHGKRSDYPLTAGMYKTENSHDIVVSATTTQLNENHNLYVDPSAIPASIIDNSHQKITITVTNKGNVFEIGDTITVSSDKNLAIDPQVIKIPILAPYEKKGITVNLTSNVKNKRLVVPLSILVNGVILFNNQVVIIPHIYDLSIKIALIVAGIFCFMLLVKLMRFKGKKN